MFEHEIFSEEIYNFLFRIFQWSTSRVLHFTVHKYNCNTIPVAKEHDYLSLFLKVEILSRAHNVRITLNYLIVLLGKLTQTFLSE